MVRGDCRRYQKRKYWHRLWDNTRTRSCLRYNQLSIRFRSRLHPWLWQYQKWPAWRRWRSTRWNEPCGDQHICWSIQQKSAWLASYWQSWSNYSPSTKPECHIHNVIIQIPIRLDEPFGDESICVRIYGFISCYAPACVQPEVNGKRGRLQTICCLEPWYPSEWNSLRRYHPRRLHAVWLFLGGLVLDVVSARNLPVGRAGCHRITSLTSAST